MRFPKQQQEQGCWIRLCFPLVLCLRVCLSSRLPVSRPPHGTPGAVPLCLGLSQDPGASELGPGPMGSEPRGCS